MRIENIYSGTTWPLVTIGDISGGSEYKYASLEMRTGNGGTAVGPQIKMYAKSGQGTGTFYENIDNTNQKWYVGVPYDGAGKFQIGAHSGAPHYGYGSVMTLVSGSGSVGIGTARPYTTGMLHVYGNQKTRIAYFQNDGDNASYEGINVRAGTDNQSGTTIFFEADDGDGQGVGVLENASGTFQLRDTSDSRLKDNIRDTAITGSNIINSIKVRDFEWKKNGIGVTAGLVAQELTSSFAQAVSSGSADKVLGYSVLGISKERLVPVLVKALQESMERIETLEAQMAQVSGSS